MTYVRFAVKNAEGEVVRDGTCALDAVAVQAGEGETAEVVPDPDA